MNNLQRIANLNQVLEEIFQHRSSNNLSNSTAYSVPQARLFPDAETVFVADIKPLQVALLAPRTINLYGHYAMSIDTDKQDRAVFIFVPVPDVEDIVHLAHQGDSNGTD